jgi:hypothetical protein
MNVKPVFENFSDFVDFLSDDDEYVLEGSEGSGLRLFEGKEITVEEFMSRLSSFLDKAAKAAFDGFKLTLSGSPLYTSKDGSNFLAKTKTELDELATRIENYQDKEDKNGISIELLDTHQEEIVISQMVSGKIKVVKLPSLAEANADPTRAFLKNNEWNSLEDVLSFVNTANISTTFPYLGKNKKKWVLTKDTKSVAGAGSYLQRVISDISTGVNFVKIPYGANPPVIFASKNASNCQDLDSTKTYVKASKYNFVQKQIVIYTVKNLKVGKGDEIPGTYIKKEFSTIYVDGAITEVDRSLSGTYAMFDQGVATLKKSNEESTKKAIDQLLGEFNYIESIEITGGASFEGGLELNKKLVVDRANTTKTLLETIHPELKGRVTVNDKDFSKIQPTDVSKDYPKWRKIYMKVKGSILGEKQKITKERDVVVGGPIYSDEVTLNQYIINLEFGKPGK